MKLFLQYLLVTLTVVTSEENLSSSKKDKRQYQQGALFYPNGNWTRNFDNRPFTAEHQTEPPPNSISNQLEDPRYHDDHSRFNPEEPVLPQSKSIGYANKFQGEGEYRIPEYFNNPGGQEVETSIITDDQAEVPIYQIEDIQVPYGHRTIPRKHQNILPQQSSHLRDESQSTEGHDFGYSHKVKDEHSHGLSAAGGHNSINHEHINTVSENLASNGQISFHSENTEGIIDNPEGLKPSQETLKNHHQPNTEERDYYSENNGKAEQQYRLYDTTTVSPRFPTTPRFYSPKPFEILKSNTRPTEQPKVYTSKDRKTNKDVLHENRLSASRKPGYGYKKQNTETEGVGSEDLRHSGFESPPDFEKIPSREQQPVKYEEQGLFDGLQRPFEIPDTNFFKPDERFRSPQEPGYQLFNPNSGKNLYTTEKNVRDDFSFNQNNEEYQQNSVNYFRDKPKGYTYQEPQKSLAQEAGAASFDQSQNEADTDLVYNRYQPQELLLETEPPVATSLVYPSTDTSTIGYTNAVISTTPLAYIPPKNNLYQPISSYEDPANKAVEAAIPIVNTDNKLKQIQQLRPTYGIQYKTNPPPSLTEITTHDELEDTSSKPELVNYPKHKDPSNPNKPNLHQKPKYVAHPPTPDYSTIPTPSVLKTDYPTAPPPRQHDILPIGNQKLEPVTNIPNIAVSKDSPKVVKTKLVSAQNLPLTYTKTQPLPVPKLQAGPVTPHSFFGQHPHKSIKPQKPYTNANSVPFNILYPKKQVPQAAQQSYGQNAQVYQTPAVHHQQAPIKPAPAYNQPSAPAYVSRPQQPVYQAPSAQSIAQAPVNPQVYQNQLPVHQNYPQPSLPQAQPQIPQPPPLSQLQPQFQQQHSLPQAHSQLPLQPIYRTPQVAPQQPVARPIAAQSVQPNQQFALQQGYQPQIANVPTGFNAAQFAAPAGISQGQLAQQQALLSAQGIPGQQPPVFTPQEIPTTPANDSQWAFGTIPYVVEKLGLNSLIDLVILAELDDVLEKQGPFTVFVPTDKAFDFLTAKFGGKEASLAQFEKDPEGLKSLLKHHMVPNLIPSIALSDNFLLQSVVGTPLRFKVTQAEDHDWKPLKVVTVNGARILKTDIKATNGIVHIIDRVMFPIPQADVYSTLKADEKKRFTLLTSAIEKAGLVPVLSDVRAGPFTIFAPTDNAFRMVNKIQLNKILGNPTALKQLLLKHVVQDAIYTAGLQAFQSPVSLANVPLHVFHKRGATKVNGANVVEGDIPAVNGVVHIIDSVLGL